MAKKHVPFVIAYDFDGTLSPGNMQEYDFVPALGIKPADFGARPRRWPRSSRRTKFWLICG